MATKRKKFNIKSFWIKTWKLLEPSQNQITKLLVLIMVMEAIRLLGPYILKIIIDRITGFEFSQINILFWLIMAMFAVNQVVSFLDYFVDRDIFKIMSGAIRYLSNDAFRKMVFLDLGYHEKENTGNKIVKINRGVDKIEGLFANFFWEVAPTVFQIILTTATLFWVNWTFAVVVLIFVPVFVILTFKVNKFVYPYRLKRYDKQEEAAGIMTQAIININTVKSFVQEIREYKNFARESEKIRSSLLSEFGYILKFNIFRNFVIDLGRGLVLLLGIYLVVRGQITVGSVVFVYTISEKALLSLFRISRLYDRIMESSEAIERLYDLSKEKAGIKNPKNGFVPKKLEGNIEFRNVVYAYPDSSVKALNGVSFKILSGCVTALVGPSGGGKTTIARLIYRHYDPTRGEVMLDGKNLKEHDLYAFRRFISIVPQEVEVFNMTVRDNIAYATPGATREEVEAAARIANAEEFIKGLKAGYDTVVGERGVKLSGGQRQRIGIARAILANPRVLIFDEATSSLDSYSERLIQEAMDKVSKNRTVIIIAHRLSTIKKADKIVVLENGRVAEEGSHTELSQIEGGLYQKLINLQKMGDVE